MAQLVICMLTMYDSPVFRFPEPFKLCMVVHTCNFSTQRWRQEDQKFMVIFSSVSSGLVWDT